MEQDVRFYLDTEFNGHGGELLSLAIAGEDGKHWYGIHPNAITSRLHPWVVEHVAPHWHKMPTTLPAGALITEQLFRASLHEFLARRAGNIIYADWPDDFAHLMRVMSGPSYEQSWIVDISMQLLTESEPRPDFPHNALSDAIALMHWHKLQGDG